MCWCHPCVSAGKVKGQLSVHENAKQWVHWLSEYNLKYPLLQGLVQGSLLSNTSTNRLRDTLQIPSRRRRRRRTRRGLQRIWELQDGRKHRKLKDTSSWDTRPVLTTENMDILETYAYDRKQKRNMVPTTISTNNYELIVDCITKTHPVWTWLSCLWSFECLLVHI